MRSRYSVSYLRETETTAGFMTGDTLPVDGNVLRSLK